MLRFMAGVFAALLSTSSALAQNAVASYPNRPIRIIVCMSAGGGVDTVTRIVANGLQNWLGQPVMFRTGRAPVAISAPKRCSLPIQTATCCWPHHRRR